MASADVLLVEDVTDEVSALIADIRARADAFIFLSGGASKLPDAVQARIVHLLGALTILGRRGLRFAVADGGMQAGVMEAAGLARRAGGQDFPLIGVAPAPELGVTLPAGQETAVLIPMAGAATAASAPTDGATTERATRGTATDGRTPVEPNHTHIIAVNDPAWERRQRIAGWTPADGFWGSETETMYRLFGRLAEGRPSVTLVANGGAIVLDEVRANVEAGRPMILVAGSGRAADALVSLLRDDPPTATRTPAPDGDATHEDADGDDDVRQLRTRAQALGLPGLRELYHLVDLDAGPESLAALLASLLT